MSRPPAAPVRQHRADAAPHRRTVATVCRPPRADESALLSPRWLRRAYAGCIDARTSHALIHIDSQAAGRAIQLPDIFDAALPLVAAVVLFAAVVVTAVWLLRRVIIRRNPDLLEREEQLPPADA